MLILTLVFALVLMPARIGACRQRGFRQSQLPVRTYVVDCLSGFAVYQQVAADVRLKQQRPPLSMQLCPYDKLGSHSWPPTAVCWVAPPTALQNRPQSSQLIIADSAAAVDLGSAAFLRQADQAGKTGAMCGVYSLAAMDVTLPAQKGSYSLGHTQLKTGELPSPWLNLMLSAYKFLPPVYMLCTHYQPLPMTR